MKARDIFDGLLVVAIIALVVALYAAVGTPEFQDEVILERHIAEATQRKEMHPCDATMLSYGPGERWHPKAMEREPECVARAKRMPDWILTSPIPEGK